MCVPVSTPVCLCVLQRAVPRSEDAAYWGLSLKELAAGRSFRTRGSSQVSEGPLCIVHCVCACVYREEGRTCGATVFVCLCIVLFPGHLALISSSLGMRLVCVVCVYSTLHRTHPCGIPVRS